jgi:hypothetical protein
LSILYAYIYLSRTRAVKDSHNFYYYLHEVYNKILNHTKNKAYTELENKYFNIMQDKTTKSNIMINYKQEEIDQKLQTSGFFILLSNQKLDKQDAYNIYRRKDVVENHLITTKTILVLIVSTYMEVKE